MATTTHITDSINMPGKSRFNLGIRQKVLLVMLVILITALAISCWSALRKEREGMLAEISQRGNDISWYVAKSLSSSMVNLDNHSIKQILDEITTSEDISYTRVTDTKGKVMGESGVSDTKTKSDNMMVFYQKITMQGEQIGNLEMGISTTHMLSRLESQKYNLLLREALIILMIVVGVFLAMSYIIVKPLSRITNHLRTSIATDGHLKENIPILSNDEFGQMARQFNNLSTQLFTANTQLQSRVDMADRRLLETNAQLKQLNEEFKILSITDPLTGLFNRRHFDELMTTEIGMSIRHGDANSILLIDIDHFKAINDTFGHYVGDTVLKNLTRILKNTLRHTDAICRIGGEEFAVLCRRADAISATEIAEKLLKEVENSALAQDVDDDLVVTISIGIATVPNSRGTHTAEQVYKDVDTALYYSKNHGRNCCTHADLLYNEDKTRTA
jgi:diguanylate cyclase (GGDEF)-like protein